MRSMWRAAWTAAMRSIKKEFFESGSFTEGRFGLYTGWQSGGPLFSDFELLDGSTLDLSTFILRADVNRATGDIVVSNSTGDAVEFDFYQFWQIRRGRAARQTGAGDL